MTRNRIIITDPEGKHEATFQTRRWLLFWRNVGRTESFATLPGLLITIAEIHDQIVTAQRGGRSPRHLRRRQERDLARLIRLSRVNLQG